jgi:hypothetical protein
MHEFGVNSVEKGAVEIGVIAVLCLPVDGGRGGGRVCSGVECKGYQGYDHDLAAAETVKCPKWKVASADSLWRYVWAEHLLFKVL